MGKDANIGVEARWKMAVLQQAIAGIKVGEPKVFGGLAVFPLIGMRQPKRDYVTLREAFGKEGIEISEVSHGGSVPELRLKNLLDQDVFAADGEALLGAKQNRVLNSSIYVKAGDEIVIPVSCVEQGRWSYRSRNFRQSEVSEFLSSRAAKMHSVDMSLKRTGTDRYSDQGAVWDEVSAKGRMFGAHSPTSSMMDVYESGRESLDRYLHEIGMQPNQVGIACAIDGRTVGVEFFENTGVFEQFFDKLVRAYAAEVAFDNRIATMVPDTKALQDLLDRLGTVRQREYEAVGSGRELRFELGSLTGSALAVDDRVLHMAVLRRKSRRVF